MTLQHESKFSPSPTDYNYNNLLAVAGGAAHEYTTMMVIHI